MRKALLASASLLVLGACATGQGTMMPAYPAPPPMPISMPTPPPPPPPPADGIVKYRKADRIGATYEVPAGEDRLYTVKIGAGSLTEPPEIKWVELPEGVIFSEAICDNQSLYDIYGTFTGARNPTYMVAIKALEPDLAPRTGECSLMTSEGRFQLKLRVIKGRTGGVTTVRLKGSGRKDGRNPDNIIAPKALCQDNFFNVSGGAYWRPLSVCATHNSTVITLDPRTQKMPSVHAWGNQGWEIVNSQIAGKTMTVVGVQRALRLVGENSEVVDITRTGAY